MKKPKVNFKIADKDKIAEFIFSLRESLDNSEGFNPRDCIRINFPSKVKKEIKNSKELNSELKEKIKQYIEISKNDINKMKSFSKKLKDRWSEINDIFFEEMEKIMGKDHIKDEYNCYMTDKVVGAYYGEADITIGYEENRDIDYACFILAEEISHLIYWKLWEEIYNKKIDRKNIDYVFAIKSNNKKGQTWSCWHIAEIIPEYILTQNPEFEKFGWNKRQRSLGYTWIPDLKKILDPIWKESKDFRDFVKKAHEKVGITENKIDEAKERFQKH